MYLDLKYFHRVSLMLCKVTHIFFVFFVLLGALRDIHIGIWSPTQQLRTAFETLVGSQFVIKRSSSAADVEVDVSHFITLV